MLLYFNFFLIPLLSIHLHKPFSIQLRTVTVLFSIMLITVKTSFAPFSI